MRNWIFPALLFSLSLVACGPAKIASVNGTKITVADLDQRMHMMLPQYDAVLFKQPARALAFKQKALNSLIDETLLLQQATKAGITISANELAEEYTRYKSQYTEQRFQDMLAQRHLSYDAWKDDRRRNAIIERLRDRDTGVPKTISDEQIATYYNKHPDEFMRSDEVRVRHILVNQESTAKMVHDKIIAGDNFAALAQQYSASPESKQGGDLGFIRKGNFPPVFDKNCFNLPVGAVSDVVKSEYGYHIFKVIDRHPARKIPMSEARKEIVQRLTVANQENAFESDLKHLHDTAKISIDMKKLEKLEVPYESNTASAHQH